MESLLEEKSRIRSDIHSNLDAFEKLFAQELAQKLSDRNESFAAEKDVYLQQINSLNLKVARIHELEDENHQLNVKLKCPHRKRQQTSSQEEFKTLEHDGPNIQGDLGTNDGNVDIGEYNRIKNLLAERDRDYGKAVFARQVLESKLRRYKDMTKQWREYSNKWILGNPKKQRRSLDGPRYGRDVDGSDLSSSTAPAPPSIPESIRITSSLCDDSRSASPSMANMDDRPYSKGAMQCHNGSHEVLSESITTRRKAHQNERVAHFDDLTEGSEESEIRRTSAMKDPEEILIRSGFQNATVCSDQSIDLPVFVSERSVHKRQMPGKGHEDAPRRPSVKDESRSSDPVPVSTSIVRNAPHDSLDLDDVGGHIVTPRKRRKLALAKSSWADKKSNKVPDDGIRLQHEDGLIKDEDDQFVIGGPQTPLRLSPELPKPSTHRCKIDQDKIQRKATSRAQQQAHNRRSRERLGTTVQSPKNDVHVSKESTHPCHKGNEPPNSPLVDLYPTPRIDDYYRPRTLKNRLESRQGERPPAVTPTILQSLDPNTHVLPRTDETPVNRKARRSPMRRKRDAPPVPALAEDGDDSPSVSHKSSLSPGKTSKISGAHDRLGTLLSRPSPANSLMEVKLATGGNFKGLKSSDTPIPRSTRHQIPNNPLTPLSEPIRKPVRKEDARRKADIKHSSDQKLLAGKKAQLAKTAVNESGKTLAFRKSLPAGPLPDDQPEHEPLRARPLHRLRLDDFKLNPAHSEYAYHESTRKHDEKKSTSGCTDRYCLRCKDIRKFVEQSTYAQVPGKDTELADRRLVEEYIGDSRQLDKLSEGERKEVVIQAKIKQFADKFGKHRTYFQRAASPVDYWNTDFPTTQEQRKNREAVLKREREKIEMMHWEAMRKGGMYVFADE